MLIENSFSFLLVIQFFFDKLSIFNFFEVLFHDSQKLGVPLVAELLLETLLAALFLIEDLLHLHLGFAERSDRVPTTVRFAFDGVHLKKLF